ncbi:tyrosine-type recombinase/integrase [Arthrobacter sp. A5]|uniref:tyrosine-type recombinase/integrase n=1 Tax=Arthrobacter sp. A5 TaxID=576926 RepID=UPI003DA7E05D
MGFGSTSFAICRQSTSPAIRTRASSAPSVSARSGTASPDVPPPTRAAACSRCGVGRQTSSRTGLDLFPSERGGLVVESTLLRRLRRYCNELGFPDGLDIHSFRRSYATHLLEAGWDPRFVQDQMGHEYASTTGIYQFVSDEFRRSTLRAALDRTVTEALARSNKDGTR